MKENIFACHGNTGECTCKGKYIGANCETEVCDSKYEYKDSNGKCQGNVIIVNSIWHLNYHIRKLHLQ